MELFGSKKKISDFVVKENKSVLLFQGSTYPYLFFLDFITTLQHSLDAHHVQKVDILQEFSLLQSQFSTTFLGQSCIYWLGNCSILKQKEQEVLSSYLSSYQGPHKICAFFDNKTEWTSSDHLEIITIQDSYSSTDIKSLIQDENLQQAQKNAYFFNKIYKLKKTFSLDELFLLKNYVSVLNLQTSEFYETWLYRIVVADASLYTLSQYFFEKKKHLFFTTWLAMKDQYSHVFWIVFWSEQLYRAYFFTLYTKQGNYMDAKKVSFGLPFAFIKQGWKHMTLAQLQRLHSHMYTIDYSFKNGGSVYEMDIFFMKAMLT